jgi:flavin-dependent dehydrogenase
MSGPEPVEVAIVGGGPAGAALAIALASAGREVVVFERQTEPRWRAGGVYSSPRTWRSLRDLGLDPGAVAALVRPIPAMEVRTTRSAACRLEHEAPYACGVDRVRLEAALLARAREAGACVLEGRPVRALGLDPAGPAVLTVSERGAAPRHWRARTVVGADGPRSLVARAAGVDAGVRWYRRAGITVHLADHGAAVAGRPATATMTLGDGWYCGIAPVPGDRVNVGIVLPVDRLAAAAGSRAHPEDLVTSILASLPGPAGALHAAPPTDRVRVALPLAHRPRRVAGPGWLLVGDAAGFIDPLSGEGLQRAFASAARAADVLLGDHDRAATADLYHRWMRGRYRPKDAVSWVLQAFLARPGLAGYALDRMARRPSLARTFGAVLTDLAPATRALDPRFLARLLAP